MVPKQTAFAILSNYKEYTMSKQHGFLDTAENSKNVQTSIDNAETDRRAERKIKAHTGATKLMAFLSRGTRVIQGDHAVVNLYNQGIMK